LGAPLQEGHAPRPDLLDGPVVDVEDADLQAPVGERDGQRQPDVAAAPHDADVVAELGPVRAPHLVRQVPAPGRRRGRRLVEADLHRVSPPKPRLSGPGLLLEVRLGTVRISLSWTRTNREKPNPSYNRISGRSP